jgi:hypothetical protein
LVLKFSQKEEDLNTMASFLLLKFMLRAFTLHISGKDPTTCTGMKQILPE